MTWNFRAIKHEKDGEEWIAIHEVYYDQKGKPTGFVVDPCPVTAEDEEGMRVTLTRMIGALDLAPLKPNDFSTAFEPEE